MSRGVTYIEIVIIIGLIGLVSFVSTPFFSRSLLRNNTSTATEVIVNVLRKAQQYSINKKSNATWGVCLTNGKVRLYTGTCASPTLREDTSLPGGVTITGFSAVTFSALRGEPSVIQTITVTAGTKTQTISVNRVGGMDIN